MSRRYPDTEGTIYFGSYEDFKPYQCFSNFFFAPIMWEGVSYKSVEHAYQAAKTDVIAEQLDIRNARTATEAKRLGSKCKMRRDWLDVRRRVMKNLVRAKVFQHDEIRKLLATTKDKTLVEEAPWDEYWGNGKDGSGKNELGKILMEVREEILSRDPQ